MMYYIAYLLVVNIISIGILKIKKDVLKIKTTLTLLEIITNNLTQPNYDTRNDKPMGRKQA